MNNPERVGKFKDSRFDAAGNEYRAHMPVSYGAFLKEALKRIEENKQIYPDLVTPKMAEVIKKLVYSPVEKGGIDGEIYERDVIFALRDLGETKGWSKDEDVDLEMVREQILKQAE